MKKKFAFAFTLALFTTAALYAATCENHYGILRCSKGFVDDIHFRGAVDLKGTTVSHSFWVQGNAEIQNSHLNATFNRGISRVTQTVIAGSLEIVGVFDANQTEIINTAKIIGDFYGDHVTLARSSHIVGTVECHSCQFREDATLTGDVATNYSKFDGELILNAKNSSFENSQLNNIHVTKPRNAEKQVMHLRQGTVVKDIFFESGEGIVVLHDNAKILGTVTGGKVIK